jgi:hypothetical protein
MTVDAPKPRMAPAALGISAKPAMTVDEERAIGTFLPGMLGVATL